MLTAVPHPDRPLTVLWQSTVIDIEPGLAMGMTTTLRRSTRRLRS